MVCSRTRVDEAVNDDVEVVVTCEEVDGPKTRWSVVARDEVDVIGEGNHERFTINRGKFDKIVAGKKV